MGHAKLSGSSVHHFVVFRHRGKAFLDEALALAITGSPSWLARTVQRYEASMSFFLFCSLYYTTRFHVTWVCSGSQNPKQISQGSMPPDPPRSLLFRRSFMKSVSGYPRSASGTLYLRGLQWSVMKWSAHNLFISISFSATFFSVTLNYS